MTKRKGDLFIGKKVMGVALLGLLSCQSVLADYKLVLTDKDGFQTEQCIKSYSFSNNLESIAMQVGTVGDVYSETETLTNKVYLGKPVYRKVFKLGDYIVSKGNTIDKSTGEISSDIDEIVDFSFKVYSGDRLFSQNDTRYTIYNNGNSTMIRANYFKNTKEIVIKLRDTTIDITATGATVIAEYTKTTDTATTTSNDFKSYLHYVPSSSTTGEVTTIDMDELGVQFLKNYTYDDSISSCTKIQ